MVAFLQKVEPGMKAAEEEKDDFKANLLHWMYSRFMLLAGSRPDNTVTVSKFLAHVKKVRF